MGQAVRVTVRDERGKYRPVSEHEDITLVRAHVSGVEVAVLESCNSTWLFDAERARYRRVPRGTKYDLPVPDSEWEPFFGLELLPATDAFVVRLNESGTKLLRAYRHRDPCEQCGTDATGELTLASIGEAGP